MPAPILCDRSAEECDLMDELAHVDASLERLTSRRHELKRKINRLYSPIIRQLPSDVMSTIFEFCIPDFADFQAYPRPSKVDLSIPLSLGAICSYWREIAWSTPCLWSSLVVRVNPCKSHSHMVIVQEWLPRSGQLPLSIRIFANLRIGQDPVPKHWRKAIQDLANVINQYSTRWFDLDLRMPQRFYRYFHATDNHAPILKSIELRDSEFDTGSFRLTCPRLERAKLSLYVMEADKINIEWHNLTHIHLHNVPIEECFTILCNTPRLVFCKLSEVRSGGLGPTTPLILTSLRSLLIGGADPEEFLHRLVTPQLEELSFSPTYLPMEALEFFFKRSASSLRFFSITFALIVDFNDFISLLRTIPSLKRLSITSDEFYHCPSDLRNAMQLVNKVLSSQRTTPRQGFLPNLEVFEFTGPQNLHPWIYSDIYPFPPAENAVHGPFHLLRLDRIYTTTHIPKNDLTFFLSLVERGVKVDVFSRSKDILQSSVNYYREKQEFSCRDWVDNLDLSLMNQLE